MRNADGIACYSNNPRLKTRNASMVFTQHQIEEIIKCSQDVNYFGANYCKIIHVDKGLIDFDPYPFQIKMLETMQDNRFVVIKTGRQQGKTTTAAIFLLWFTLFQDDKLVGILANKGDLAREILDRYQNMYEYLPFFMQQGIISWNKGSIELENGSKVIATSTSSSSARGFAFSALYIDELAFVHPNVWEEFYTSVYPTISSGTETRIILTSTPNGLNHFWKIWNNSIEGKSLYANFSAIWSDVPWKDEKWKAEQIANTSEQQFRQEHEADFLGSSNTLIPASKLQAIATFNPYNIRDDGAKIFRNPEKDRRYVLVADTARGRRLDYSAFIIFDVTEEPYNVVCVYRSNVIEPLFFSWVINFYGKAYNEAHVLCELNDAGGQVADSLHYEHEYENIIKTKADPKVGGFKPTESSKSSRRGVVTTKTVKNQGCTSLRALIEKNVLLINDEDILIELTHFTKYGSSFAAESSYHDDLVMCLVLFSWLSTTHSFSSIINSEIMSSQGTATALDIGLGEYPSEWTLIENNNRSGITDDSIFSEENNALLINNNGMPSSFDEFFQGPK